MLGAGRGCGGTVDTTIRFASVNGERRGVRRSWRIINMGEGSGVRDIAPTALSWFSVNVTGGWYYNGIVGV
jgi:hypothetical protein